jgi:hypothetical protein
MTGWLPNIRSLLGGLNISSDFENNYPGKAFLSVFNTYLVYTKITQPSIDQKWNLFEPKLCLKIAYMLNV